MKALLLQFLVVILFVGSLTSCSQSSHELPQPTAKAVTDDANVSSWGMYTQSGAAMQPEFMVDIAARFKGRNTVGGTTGNDLLTLGKTKVPGGNKIWFFYQYQCLCGEGSTYQPYNVGSWTAIPGPNGGGAVKVASTNGAWYVIDDQNQLWTAGSSLSTTTTWTKLPFLAVDIATYGSYTYFLGATPVYGGYRIYRLTGSGSSSVATEVVTGSAATSIAVDEQGRPWVVNSLNEIFVGPLPNSGGGFALVTGKAYDIASTGESVAIISTNPTGGGYSIYTRDITAPNNYAWSTGPGGALKIAASQGIYGSYFVCNTLGEIFKGGS